MDFNVIRYLVSTTDWKI